jgi:hypothetical protein
MKEIGRAVNNFTAIEDGIFITANYSCLGLYKRRKKRFGRKYFQLEVTKMFGLLLCFLFFGSQLFHHLAFTITMQLGPGFVDTVFNVGSRVGVVISNDKTFAESLHEEGYRE